jgi:hypothetical protein
MNSQYISLLDQSVIVNSDRKEVFSQIFFEIGDYFEFTVENNYDEVIGIVNYFSQPELFEEVQHKYGALPCSEIVMHNGPRKDDLRVGVELKFEGLRVIHSLTTGSFFEINNLTRTVNIYNQNIKRGATDIRRLVRNQIFFPFFRQTGGISVHSSAFSYNEKATLIIGASGSGKTSLFLAALANSYNFSFLSCECILLYPEDNKIRVLASPETITFFPGTLASFRETSDLIKTIDVADFWKKDKKIRLSWREIFDRFDAKPPSQPVYLSKIIFPMFSNENSDEVLIEDLDRKTTCDLLKQNLISSHHPSRPNWLSWYDDGDSSKIFNLIDEISSIKLQWSCNTNLVEFIGNI